jgi:RNA polymerase sigma-70 factor (ECF subfamily)
MTERGSERDLVEKAKQRDPEATSELYDLYVDKVYRYLYYKVGHPVEAEDLTETVFLRVLEALPRFSWKNVPFSAWVFSIARNLVIDHYRRRARRTEVAFEEVGPLFADGGDPHEAAERSLLQQRLEEAISTLTTEQKEVVLLKFFVGLSNAEISALLRKSDGAIKSIQHRGLRSLRKKLESET